MPSCNLCGRSQNSKSKEKNITFHRYPKCHVIREKWIEFSRLYDEHRSIVVNEKSVVCSAHFVADSFNAYIKNTVLKPTAIPSIVIHRVRYGKLEYPETNTNLISNEKEKVNIAAEDTGCSSSPITNSTKVEIEMDGVECLELSSFDSKTLNASISPISTIPDKELSAKVNRELFVEASVVEDDDTPRRRFLKRGISVLASETSLKSKKIKILNQTIRRQQKKIVSLKNIILKLKDQNLIYEDISTLLLDNFGENKHLIARLSEKNAGMSLTSKYSPELHKFAISLHFRSVSAYNFVRK